MNNQEEEQINSYRQAIPAFSEQLIDSDNENDSAGVQSSLSSTLQSLGMLRRDRRSRLDRAQPLPVVAAPSLDIPSVARRAVERKVEEPQRSAAPEKKKTASHAYDGQLIANLKRRYPNGLKYELQPLDEKIGDENRLDLADMVESDKEAREKANYFACAICTMVVHQPIECKSCDSLFCAECLDPWASKNKHCPKKCKGNEAVNFGSMHRFAKQELEALKFKCKTAKCSSVAKYGDALKHIHTCEQQMQACPQGCGMGLHDEDFEYHFQIQCPKTKHVCKECDEDIFTNDTEEHNCLATLKKLLAASRKENETLRLENSQNSGSSRSHHVHGGRSSLVESYGSSLADEAAPISLNDSEEEDEDEMEIDERALVENRCHNGHTLRAQYERITAYETVCCDICECSNLNDDAVFYRCGPCNYDICQACASDIELQNY